MKRIIVIVLGVMMVFMLSACDDIEMDDRTGTTPLVFGTDYEVENIRTEPLMGYPEDGVEEVYWIESLSDLETYVQEYEVIFDFDWDNPSFYEHIEQYDEAFFEDFHLFFVIVSEPSGSIRHGVEEITAAEGVLNIHMSRSVPEIGTTDMACWHVVVQLEKDAHDFHSVELIVE